MSIDISSAQELVALELQRLEKKSRVALAFRSEKTLERSFGWVFFYNSKLFVETGEFKHRLAGNGPIVVEKWTGEVFTYGSTPSVEEVIAAHEAKAALAQNTRPESSSG